MDDREYTLEQAAARLHLSVRSVQRLIEHQLLGHERVGVRGVRVRESDCAAFELAIRAQRANRR